jgi:ATP-dependent RNA helicase DHX36
MSSAYARPTKAAQPTGRQNALPGSAMNNQSGENSPAKPTKGRQSKQGKQSTHGNQPRQQKQSSQSNQHVGQPITMEYIQDHFSLPTRAQYANAPNAFWYLLEQNAPHVKQSYVQKIFADHLNFQRSKKGTPPHGHSHRLQFIAQAYDGRQYAAVGDGTTETEALRICAIHLIAQLHETGQLNQFFGRPAIEIVTKDTRGSHNHKVAVYEYASRFTEVPQFTARPVTDEVLQKVRAQGNYKVKYECTAELPELGLVAIGAGVTLTQAENAAAIRLEVLAREREELAHRDSPLKASTMDSFLNYWDHGKGVLTTSYTERTITGHKIYTAHAELGGQPCGKPVSLIQRSQAEHLAILSAAIALGKEDPTLLPGFEAALEEAGGKIPRRLKPIQISLPDRVLDSMESAIKEQRGVKTHDKPLPVEGVSDAPMRTRSVRGFTNQDQRNAALQQAFKAYQESSSTQLMRKKREELPINLHRAEILDMCKDSPFSVVVGATGSGKTTQVPQMFLEAASEMGEGALCNVICTQPRRIAAVSLFDAWRDDVLLTYPLLDFSRTTCR